MDRIKIVVVGVVMAAVATIIQSIPAYLSESFALLTLFSSVPIYTAARTNPVSGAISYIATAILVFFSSADQALYFLFANGVVGASLGATNYFKLNKPITLAASTGALSLTSGILDFGFKQPFLGVDLPGNLIVKIIILIGASFAYNFGYSIFADFVYKKIGSSGINDIGSGGE
ncbi:hypothetical protein QA584_09460 [Anaerocolumna sp. AGMB13025]|uniref:hypothetical protein n=1 Tax=Anaerocolumna sp. AGMB13025 TaxID=3039116 RepID=UPI00241D44B4|nr:hypothetical protein [Anaerocolumna sp. AGMB13025]WFR59293.1 hypothetical protein QA584_09460 [Anaerocolumna sp. AGMB13025]